MGVESEPSTDAAGEVAELYAALLFLLTRYAESPSWPLAEAVNKHIGQLMKCPAVISDPVLGGVCRAVCLRWRALALLESRQSPIAASITPESETRH